MSEFVSVIFCRICSSRYIDVTEWSEEGNAVVKCRSCGNREEMGKFSLGRCSVSKPELQNARDTLATKNKYER